MFEQQEELLKILGGNLRKSRAQLSVSQEAFAEHLRYHRTYVGDLERGERNLTLASLEHLAERLGVDPLNLLGKSSRPGQVGGNLQNRLGRNMRSDRSNRGLTRREYATILGFGPTYLGTLESGRRNVSLIKLQLYAARLGVDPLDLLRN